MENTLIIENGVLQNCTSRETFVNVPLGVHTIGEGAFKGCTSLEEVCLPETVTHIMDNAFKGCRKLKQINFPDQLEYVGDYAFHRCHSLLEVKLPNSVKALGNCVFLFCDELKYASIAGVTQLGRQVFFQDLNLQTLEISPELSPEGISDVFMGCSRLTEIKLTDGTIFSSENMLDFLNETSDIPVIIRTIVKDMYRSMEIENGCLNKFLLNLTHVDVPEGITTIGKSCFFDKKGIISVSLPKTLNHIDCRAFRNCINLEKIILANDKIEISQDAFKNCTTLKYIVMPNGQEYELKGLPDNASTDVPKIVSTIHSQMMSNFYISGTKLIEYRGSEQKVVVPEGIKTISERAFAGNVAIDRIILPETLEEIHDEAFADCVLLQKIYIPEGLKYIGESAFENCVKLISVDLPQSLTRVEKSVFNRCKKLKEVNFGSNIQTIGELSFYGCVSLEKVILPNSLKVLGDMAFYKCGKIHEITLPKHIEKIGNNAFTLSGLRSVVLEGNISNWGSGAFAQCKKLHTLTLIEGVSRIGDKAFNNCPALINVNIPNSLKSLGENVFYDSGFGELIKDNETLGSVFINGKHLTGQVTIPEGITSIAGGAFYGNEEITEIQLPKSLEYIGTRAFGGCTGIKEINFPEKIKTIEEATFVWCSGLEIVNSTTELESIKTRAFYGCKSLSTVNLSANVIMEDAFAETKLLEEKSSLVIVGNTIIDGQGCVGEVIIPEGITSISAYAFANNKSITAVVLPKSLRIIDDGAFYGCNQLKEITGTDTIEKIGKQAFSKCVTLEQLTLKVKQVDERAFAMCKALKLADIPETMIIGKEVFAGCKSLVEVRWNQETIIGNRAFLDCISLETLVFDKQIIKPHAFENCVNITEIRLKTTELSYGSYVFSGVTALKTIYIGETAYDINGYFTLFDFSKPTIVREIYQSCISCFSIDENWKLYSCLSDAKKLSIPMGIKAIDKEVFRNAMQLEEVDIPESVEEIGARAFHSTPWLNQKIKENPMVIVNDILLDGTNCTGEVVIPENIKAISGWAFANCYGLTSINFTSKYTKIGEFAFRNCFSLKKVILSSGETFEITGIMDREESYPDPVSRIIQECFNCFNTNENGVLVECTGNISELVLAEGITEIGESVFKESNLLTQITLANSTKVINESAFEQCKWLTHVTQTKQVTKVGKKAFSCCDKLEHIEFSENLEFIGEKAFEHCVSLKTIIIPEGITVIPEKAFYRCKNVETIVLPLTLKKIESQAFAYCPNLSELIVPNGVEIATDAFLKGVSL